VRTGHGAVRLIRQDDARWASLIERCRPAFHLNKSEVDQVQVAAGLFRSVDRQASWLVNQDIHGGNILSAERESWLLIDPKPLVGERELDAVGLLRNPAWEGGTRTIRRLIDAFADIGLDRERAQGWGLAHALAWGWDERSGSTGWANFERLPLPA
jgi:streptomycin 6-kinase